MNIDSTIPNLALKKVEKYHIGKGNEIIWDMALALDSVDKAYVSCVFPENRYKCLIFEGKALIGGSGYDLSIKLPPEIDTIKPRINWGFTTRGCIRNCPFCFVPKMEGYIHVVGDIYDIWDGKSKEITLMDNNILALHNHFNLICQQLIKEKLKVDFNQGLDIRLITDDIARKLSQLRNHRFRFAFDSPRMEDEFRKGLEILLKYMSPSRFMIYVLVGFDTIFDEDMYRIRVIRGYGSDAFVMLYNKLNNPLLRQLAQWNNRFQLRHVTFKNYLERKKLSYLLGQRSREKR